MDKKFVILGKFINGKNIDKFIDKLETKYNIPQNKVFIFKILDEDDNYLITFRFLLDNKRINFKHLFNGLIHLHKKNNTLYTINSLNKLIEKESDISIGNIDYNSFIIDWPNYKNKLILTKDNELVFFNIKRIFL